MRLVMTLLVRDEQDVVQAVLDHSLDQGVDHVVVTDNLSRDRTPELLQPYVDRGVATVLREDDDTYAQSRWVTRMARLAVHELGADWVVHGDADEFWWGRGGTVRDVLARLPADLTVARVARRNLLPRPEDGRPFWERMVLAETRSTNDLGRPLPPKVCHRASPDVVVAQGNHAVQGTGLGPAVDVPDLDIAHYPLRSWEQYARKISSGGAAYARNTELPERVGATWRQAYRLLQDDRLREQYDARERLHADPAPALARGELVVDTRLRDELRRRTGG